MRYFSAVATIFVLCFFIMNCGPKLRKPPPNYPGKGQIDVIIGYGVGEWSSSENKSISEARNRARGDVSDQIESLVETFRANVVDAVGAGDEEELNQVYKEAITSVSKNLLRMCIYDPSRDISIEDKKGQSRARVFMYYPQGEAMKAFIEQMKQRRNLYARAKTKEVLIEKEKEIEDYEAWKKENGWQ